MLLLCVFVITNSMSINKNDMANHKKHKIEYYITVTKITMTPAIVFVIS